MLLRLFLGITLLSCPAALMAQEPETRAGQADRERREKSAKLEPYKPSKFESVLYAIEDRYLPERIFNPPRGFFVRAGGMPEGQGIKGGPAWRYSNYDMSFTTTSAISIRGAWEVDARLEFPRPTLTAAPKFFSVGGVVHRLPQEDFYGVGLDSSQRLKTSYLLDETALDVTGGMAPVPWLSLSGTGEYRSERPGRTKDTTVPPTEIVFPSPVAPGLGEDVNLARLGGLAMIDLTSAPDATLVGGRYTFAVSRYVDPDDRYSFDRWDVELQQYVPLINSGRIFAFRAHATSTSPQGGNDVPVYMRPTLGGSHSLRGYRYQRFTDRSSLLLQGEYRFDLNAFMVGSVFYDAGTVGSRPKDWRLDDVRDDYGFGLRFGFGPIAGMRAEVVFGGDGGTVYALRFGDVF